MELSYEIYAHQFNFLKACASHRPALGNLYARNGRLASTNAFILFDFAESAIDKAEWIEAHAENHDWDEKLVDFYYHCEDESEDEFYGDDNESADTSKIEGKYPCASPLVGGTERSFEIFWKNIDELTAHPFKKVAEINAVELWAKCYQQRALWLGKGLACIQIPDTNFIGTVENLELALSFPLLMQSQSHVLVYQHNDMIKLCANDYQILIMSLIADTDKPQS